jgi:thermitase
VKLPGRLADPEVMGRRAGHIRGESLSATAVGRCSRFVVSWSSAPRLRFRRPFLTLALVMDLGLVLGPGCQPPATDPDVVNDELIVSVRPGADRSDLVALLEDQQAGILGELPGLSAYLVEVNPSDRRAVADRLADSPLVEGVLENRLIGVEVTPDDPDFTIQWYLQAIHAPQAWALTTGRSDVVVAVLDTGVDATHPDLADKLLPGSNTFGDSTGWQDVSGHGTSVAGIIGAESDTGKGVASVAWGCPMLPIRVTNSAGQATSWSIAAGIALAVDRGARVVNVSFSSLYDNELVLRQARQAWLAGSIVVIAADNTGQRVQGGGSEYAVFVGAIDQADQRASFSTYGEFVDLVAPGVGIYTTKPGGTYGGASGTSFSAPVVSGVAALVWSVNPQLRPATVRDILVATARDLGSPGWDLGFAAGCVDAQMAVETAAAVVEQEDSSPPTISISSPADGASLSEPTLLQVSAADNLEVADVSLYLDGALKAADPAQPYSFILDPSRHSSGQHEIRVVAADLAGNQSQAAISVSFVSAGERNPPAVEIITPHSGESVRGVVTILANVADDTVLARAEVLVDGQVVMSTPLAEASTAVAHNWNTADARVSTGTHTLAVRAYDASDNLGSDTITVTVAR